MGIIESAVMAFVVVGMVFAVLYYACTVPSSQVFGPAIVRGPSEGGRVALTFDDGPAAPFTEQILDILRERGIPATFFLCGRNVERYPEIVRRIHSQGHTLGNHTYSHPFLYFRSRRRMGEEIDRTQEVIERVTGCRPQIFRPPYGGRWFGLNSLLRERGLTMVQWSDTGFDWKNDVEAVVHATLKDLRSGAIVLLHDGRANRPPEGVDQSTTVKALPAIIEKVSKAGLRFAPISELLAAV